MSGSSAGTVRPTEASLVPWRGRDYDERYRQAVQHLLRQRPAEVEESAAVDR